jgi:hypothetical protein
MPPNLSALEIWGTRIVKFAEGAIQTLVSSARESNPSNFVAKASEGNKHERSEYKSVIIP